MTLFECLKYIFDNNVKQDKVISCQRLPFIASDILLSFLNELDKTYDPAYAMVWKHAEFDVPSELRINNCIISDYGGSEYLPYERAFATRLNQASNSIETYVVAFLPMPVLEDDDIINDNEIIDTDTTSTQNEIEKIPSDHASGSSPRESASKDPEQIEIDDEIFEQVLGSFDDVEDTTAQSIVHTVTSDFPWQQELELRSAGFRSTSFHRQTEFTSVCMINIDEEKDDTYVIMKGDKLLPIKKEWKNDVTFGERQGTWSALQKDLEQVVDRVIDRYDRIQPSVECSCLARRRCAEQGHVGDCELCILANARDRYHYGRVGFRGKFDNKDAYVAVDLISSRQTSIKKLMILLTSKVTVGDSVKTATVAVKVTAKTTQAVLLSLFRGLNLLSYFYRHTVYRLHTDKESSIWHAKDQLTRQGLHVTFSVANDSAANGVAESSNRAVSNRARQALSPISSMATKRNLWCHAMIWAAFKRSRDQCKDTDCRAMAMSLPPFLVVGMVTITSKPDTRGRCENRTEYACYLHPSYDSDASTVLMLDIKTKKGLKVMDVRSFRPCVTNKIPSFVDVSFPGNEITEVETKCRKCGCIRLLAEDQYEKARKRSKTAPNVVDCSELNVKCGKESTGLIRVRRGRNWQNKSTWYGLDNSTQTCLADSLSIMQAHPDFENYQSEMDIMHDQMMWDTRAHVTKLLSQQDIEADPAAPASIQKEMTNLQFTDKVFDMPCEVEEAAAKYPDSTISDCMVIVSRKNHEFYTGDEHSATEGGPPKIMQSEMPSDAIDITDIVNQITDEKVELEASIISDVKHVEANHSLTDLPNLGIQKRGTDLKSKLNRIAKMEQRLEQLEQIMKIVDEHTIPTDSIGAADRKHQEQAAQVQAERDKIEYQGASSKQSTLKTRCVVRGDAILPIVNLLGESFGRRIPINRAYKFADLWQPTAALASFRTVVLDCYSDPSGDKELWSVDLPSAFTQCSWPSDAPKHFVRFSPEIRRLMDPKYSGSSLKAPCFRLLKCLYGHPVSGFEYQRLLIKHLKQNGFIECEGDKGLLRHKTMDITICVYVDDIAISATQKTALWFAEIVRQQFKTDDPEPCRKYLSIEVFGTKDAGGESIVELSQTAYARTILKQYEELFPERKCHPRQAPAAWEEEESTCAHNKQDDQNSEFRTEKYVHKLQQICGSLLWLSRGTRPDITGPTGHIACGLHRWDEKMQKYLDGLIGYLTYSQNKRLIWKLNTRHKDEWNTDLVVDANWSRKSTSSHVLAVSGVDTHVTLDWSAKKIQLACMSSCASEVAALGLSTSNAICLAAWVATNILHKSMSDVNESGDALVRLLGDNSSSLRIVKRGHSALCASFLSAMHRTFRLKIQYLHQLYMARILAPRHIRTAENSADLNSKLSHPKSTFITLSQYIGVAFDVSQLRHYHIRDGADCPLNLRLCEDRIGRAKY